MLTNGRELGWERKKTRKLQRFGLRCLEGQSCKRVRSAVPMRCPSAGVEKAVGMTRAVQDKGQGSVGIAWTVFDEPR